MKARTSISISMPPELSPIAAGAGSRSRMEEGDMRLDSPLLPAVAPIIAASELPPLTEINAVRVIGVTSGECDSG